MMATLRTYLVMRKQGDCRLCVPISPLRGETIDEADDGDGDCDGGGDLLRVAVYLPNESLWRRLSSSSPMLLPDLRQTQKARLGAKEEKGTIKSLNKTYTT